ncbi:hypothetical protein OESDEN_06962 [Oesophagostomum dentatum]|uniref:Activin types I and II receptor domain-containing protein n=1 Tax=Oesophagostomum dentatum TaxID=61180 RepID=A0A0B1TBH2_OESDE|nr:hypothetical protein OESDEN_06962 [Oesophagostomum dentatum]
MHPQKEEGTPATTEQSDEQEHVAEEGNGARKKRVPDETEESQDLAEETPTQETESPAEAETSGQETNEEPTADSPTTIESETPGTPAEPKTEQECDESESQPFCTRISIFHDGNEKLVAKGCATSIQCSETKCHEHSSAVGYTGEHCCCEEDFCNAGIRKDLTLTLNIFVALLAFFKFLA